MPQHWGYPQQRERPRCEPRVLTDRFSGIEATAGYVALGTTAALVLAFTGRPNRLEISVENNDAQIDLRKELNVAADPITVRAGQTWAPDVNARYVFGNNLVAGLVASVQVIGRY
ncbi:MAG: hypothetical protein Q8R92_03040 [Deltaproteobacteria bacterium]|nr:hypothetical protein [Deltaproteobacteria bacterium]